MEIFFWIGVVLGVGGVLYAIYTLGHLNGSAKEYANSISLQEKVRGIFDQYIAAVDKRNEATHEYITTLEAALAAHKAYEDHLVQMLHDRGVTWVRRSESKGQDSQVS